MRLKLRQLRRERDITQKALADKIHVRQHTISQWERTPRIPPFEKCLAIASVLGVSVFELIDHEDQHG